MAFARLCRLRDPQPRAALCLGIVAFFLVVPTLLWLLWEQEGETRVVREGVTLEENLRGPEEQVLWGTPLARPWRELLLRARERGWRGKTNGPVSGLRTRAEQKELWLCWRRGLCPPAFHPDGPSRHLERNVRRWGQWSQAVDVSSPRDLVRIAQEMGVPLWVPYETEPWHIEALSVWTLPDREVTAASRQRYWLLLIPATLLLLMAGRTGIQGYRQWRRR